jgi:hypothetical protein
LQLRRPRNPPLPFHTQSKNTTSLSKVKNSLFPTPKITSKTTKNSRNARDPGGIQPLISFTLHSLSKSIQEAKPLKGSKSSILVQIKGCLSSLREGVLAHSSLPYWSVVKIPWCKNRSKGVQSRFFTKKLTGNTPKRSRLSPKRSGVPQFHACNFGM